MRLGTALLLLLVVALSLPAATPGIFSGTIVQPPETEETSDWIYIESRNGFVRKVRMAKATVFYSEDIAPEARSSRPADSLQPGAEVRITAVQDGSGVWNASRIEILKLTPEKRPPQAVSQVARL